MCVARGVDDRLALTTHGDPSMHATNTAAAMTVPPFASVVLMNAS